MSTKNKQKQKKRGPKKNNRIRSDKSDKSKQPGRGRGGLFAKGNTFSKGHGRPRNELYSTFRAAGEEEVKADDVRKVIRALINKAKKGDVKAIKEFLDRFMGPHPESDIFDDDNRHDEIIYHTMVADGTTLVFPPGVDPVEEYHKHMGGKQ